MMIYIMRLFNIKHDKDNIVYQINVMQWIDKPIDFEELYKVHHYAKEKVQEKATLN